MNGRMARWIGGLLAAAVMGLGTPALAQYGFFIPDPGVPASLSVTTSSGRVLLAGLGATTVVTNTGSTTARCRFGDVTVTAAATDSIILANSSRAYGTGGTHLACITASSTTTIVAETGSGIPVIAGGGASGGGGGAVDANGNQKVVSYDSTGTVIDPNAALPAGTNTIGSVGLAAGTTGGCTPGGAASAASTNATSVKASAGTLCGGIVINTTATLYYLRLYNLATAPTCSSATGFVATIPIPASTTGSGTLLQFGPFGAAFSTGIAYCLTGGGSSTDNTNAATGVYLAYAAK